MPKYDYKIYIPIEIQNIDLREHRTRTLCLVIEADDFDDAQRKATCILTEKSKMPNLYRFKFVLFTFLAIIMLLLNQPIAAIALFVYNLYNLYRIFK